MKRFYSTTVALFLLLLCSGIKAQTAQSKLNQVGLMKQFIGTWKAEIADDNVMIMEFKPFGNTITGNAKVISQDTSFDMKKFFLGYDEKNDKIIMAEIYIYTPNMDLTASWFISDNIMQSVPYQDISNPENAVIKWIFEFKPPDMLVIKSSQKNNIETIAEWTRDKK
jgi:histidinol phosphatase-like enzyme